MKLITFPRRKSKIIYKKSLQLDIKISFINKQIHQVRKDKNSDFSEFNKYYLPHGIAAVH
jgi:hypothetical protein